MILRSLSFYVPLILIFVSITFSNGLPVNSKQPEREYLLLDRGKACSSLDGPYCPGINGLKRRGKDRLQEIRKGAGNGGKSFNFNPFDWDYNEVIKSLTEQIHNLQSTNSVSGSYEVKGLIKILTDPGNTEGDTGTVYKGSKIQLIPGKWIDQPNEHWTFIGLVGEFLSLSRMHLKIVDLEGNEVDSCTDVTVDYEGLEQDITIGIENKENVNIPQKPNPLLSDADVEDVGGTSISIWTGKYSCFDVETQLKLKLKRSGIQKQTSTSKEVHVEGVFEFQVLHSPIGEQDIQIITIDADGEEIQSEKNMQDFMKEIIKQALNSVRETKLELDSDDANTDTDTDTDTDDDTNADDESEIEVIDV